jgi:hypothetical protein
VDLAFAAAHLAADDGEVPGEEVHGVGGEVVRERGDEAAQVVRVVRLGAGRAELEQLGGAHGVPLGDERERGAAPGLAALGRAGDEVVGGLAERTAQVDARGVGPVPEGFEGLAVVVVPGDDDDLGAGAAQGGQGREQEPLRLGRGRGGVEEVPGDDHEINCFCAGDVDHLLEDGALLVEARAALHGDADVPVGRVENPQGLLLSAVSSVLWARI